MTTAGVVLVAFSILIVATVVRGDVDCKQRPNISNFKDCCKVPQPKWDAYKEQCFKDQPSMSRFPNPCALTCIFNVSNALQGETLNMDNTRVMLSKLFADSQDFQQSYALGFEKCMPEVAKRVADFKAKGHTPPPKMTGKLECSPLATIFAMCAHNNVFMTCPATAWSPSDTCLQAKEYATQCEFGGPGKRGPGRGGRKFGRGGNIGKGPGLHFDRQRHHSKHDHDEREGLELETLTGFY